VPLEVATRVVATLAITGGPAGSSSLDHDFEDQEGALPVGPAPGEVAGLVEAVAVSRRRHARREPPDSIRATVGGRFRISSVNGDEQEKT
jgi:hypothetical protein